MHCKYRETAVVTVLSFYTFCIEPNKNYAYSSLYTRFQPLLSRSRLLATIELVICSLNSNAEWPCYPRKLKQAQYCTLASLWTGGTSTNTGMYMCGVGHVNRESLQDTASVSMQSNIWCVLCRFRVHWRWSTSVWS